MCERLWHLKFSNIIVAGRCPSLPKMICSSSSIASNVDFDHFQCQPNGLMPLNVRPFSDSFHWVSTQQHISSPLLWSFCRPVHAKKKTSCRLVKWVHSRLASISLRIPVLFSLFIELSSDCVWRWNSSFADGPATDVLRVLSCRVPGFVPKYLSALCRLDTDKLNESEIRWKLDFELPKPSV